LQDYILVEPERIYVEHYKKLESGRWLLTIFNRLNTTLRLESLDVEIPITEIYHKVDWLEEN